MSGKPIALTFFKFAQVFLFAGFALFPVQFFIINNYGVEKCLLTVKKKSKITKMFTFTTRKKCQCSVAAGSNNY